MPYEGCGSFMLENLKQKTKENTSELLSGLVILCHSRFLCSFWRLFVILFLQRGQKHNVRGTERVSWLVHGAHGLPLVNTSLFVTKTAPMNPCSAMVAQDTAGAWTAMDRRSQELALGPAADQCVSKLHTARDQRSRVL